MAIFSCVWCDRPGVVDNGHRADECDRCSTIRSLVEKNEKQVRFILDNVEAVSKLHHSAIYYTQVHMQTRWNRKEEKESLMNQKAPANDEVNIESPKHGQFVTQKQVIHGRVAAQDGSRNSQVEVWVKANDGYWYLQGLATADGLGEWWMTVYFGPAEPIPGPQEYELLAVFGATGITKPNTTMGVDTDFRISVTRPA